MLRADDPRLDPEQWVNVYQNGNYLMATQLKYLIENQFNLTAYMVEPHEDED